MCNRDKRTIEQREKEEKTKRKNTIEEIREQQKKSLLYFVDYDK